MKTPDLQQIDNPFSYNFSASELPVFREAVSTCYYARLMLLNDGPWYQNDQYRIRLELTPELIGCAIQNNIEAALVGEYGAEQGSINAAEMLYAMLDESDRFERTCGLSELGVTVMDEMFKSLSEIARDMVELGNSSLAPLMNQRIH